ncbi:hypothetical protein RRG08_062722 [Elysia crispata]|uniref:Uncharacterized protein n=1 Tax=Elysia crispata TaxID=231223 RepID=A0AAE1DXB5_9GAST|nr:hypothetical protein RRG08_062722 [Elysia crispata]
MKTSGCYLLSLDSRMGSPSSPRCLARSQPPSPCDDTVANPSDPPGKTVIGLLFLDRLVSSRDMTRERIGSLRSLGDTATALRNVRGPINCHYLDQHALKAYTRGRAAEQNQNGLTPIHPQHQRSVAHDPVRNSKPLVLDCLHRCQTLDDGDLKSRDRGLMIGAASAISSRIYLPWDLCPLLTLTDQWEDKVDQDYLSCEHGIDISIVLDLTEVAGRGRAVLPSLIDESVAKFYFSFSIKRRLRFSF